MLTASAHQNMSMRNWSDKHKPRNIHLMAIAVCLLVIAGLLFDWWSDQNTWHILQSSAALKQSEQTEQAMNGPELIPGNDSKKSAESTAPSELIPIYLVGAVRHPGIYRVEPGCYLYQLVEQAGGLTDDAAANQINLVMRLDYNQQIYIPTLEELAENPALLPEPGDQNDVNPLVDLNRAGQADLEKLPGIGPVTAMAIIDYRDKNGPFTTAEDIMLVPGIKESRFAALEDFIIVSEPPR